MVESLNNEVIRSWWKKISQHAINVKLKDYMGIHEPVYHPVLGKYRVMCSQIRNEESYNFLCSKGVEVNSSGEIFLSEEEAKEYVDFQEMMED